MDLGERLDPVPACYPAHEPKRRVRRGRGKIAASTSIQTEGNRTPKKDADWSENVKNVQPFPFAGFVGAYQYLCNSTTFFAVNLSS